MTPSCFNCQYFDPGHSPTFDDPGDGWGCKNDDLDEMPEENVDFTGTEDEVAQAYAKDCSGYQFFDWDAQHRLQAEAEAEYDRSMQLSESELLDLEEAQRQVQLARMTEAGLLTSDGEPTDEYFRQADYDYQVWRERR